VESREAVADASAANLQLFPIDDAPAAPEAPPEALPDNPPAAHTEANATIAAADMSSETATTESQAEVQADVIDAQHAALPDNPPAAQAEAATMVAAVADSGTATTVKESPADDAAEIIPAAEFETVTPMATVVKTGNWVINLASYTRESMANRKLALFQQQGVDAEVFEVAINDKPMYRIRLAGFESRRAAQAEVKPVEQLLGLEGVWVSKR
jgi:cell division septation protein DedD